jgi:hypothetical protein
MSLVKKAGQVQAAKKRSFYSVQVTIMRRERPQEATDTVLRDSGRHNHGASDGGIGFV